MRAVFALAEQTKQETAGYFDIDRGGFYDPSGIVKGWAIANAAYKRQKRNPGVTEIKKMPNRGHSLTIDSGWQEVADTALAFVKRFA